MHKNDFWIKNFCLTKNHFTWTNKLDIILAQEFISLVKQWKFQFRTLSFAAGLAILLKTWSWCWVSNVIELYFWWSICKSMWIFDQRNSGSTRESILLNRLWCVRQVSSRDQWDVAELGRSNPTDWVTVGTQKRRISFDEVVFEGDLRLCTTSLEFISMYLNFFSRNPIYSLVPITSYPSRFSEPSSNRNNFIFSIQSKDYFVIMAFVTLYWC